MASGSGVNQGKTAFAERFFTENSDAEEKAVNQAWKAAGNEGELSGSLIYKVRSRLGLTGKKGINGRASGRGHSDTVTKGRAESSSKPPKAGKARSQPAGSGDGPGANKTAFVEEMLRRDAQANVAAVNRAWSAAGYEGSISDSVFYKVKRERGATDQRTPAAPVTSGSKSESERTGAGPVTQPSGETRPEFEGETGSDAAGSGTGPGDRERVLDRVEDRIDDLIVELKQLGGMEEALEALRKVRRVVVRSHEG
jgi:hypothetical protein